MSKHLFPDYPDDAHPDIKACAPFTWTKTVRQLIPACGTPTASLISANGGSCSGYDVHYLGQTAEGFLLPMATIHGVLVAIADWPHETALSDF